MSKGTGKNTRIGHTHGNRLYRWFNTVLLGFMPLIASFSIHQITPQHSGYEAFRRPSEVSLLTLVLCATVLIDMNEAKYSLNWPRFSSIVVALLTICVVVASLEYARSIEIPGVQMDQIIDRGALSQQASVLALSCMALCTIVESWMALEERRK